MAELYTQSLDVHKKGLPTKSLKPRKILLLLSEVVLMNAAHQRSGVNRPLLYLRASQIDLSSICGVTSGPSEFTLLFFEEGITVYYDDD